MQRPKQSALAKKKARRVSAARKIRAAAAAARAARGPRFDLWVYYKGDNIDPVRLDRLIEKSGGEFSGSGYNFVSGERDTSYEFTTKEKAEAAKRKVREAFPRGVRCKIVTD